MIRGQNHGNSIAREGPPVTVQLDGNGLRLVIYDLDGGVPVLQHVFVSRADSEAALAVRDDRIRRCLRAVHQLDALIVSAGNRVLIGGDACAETWSIGNVVGHVSPPRRSEILERTDRSRPAGWSWASRACSNTEDSRRPGRRKPRTRRPGASRRRRPRTEWCSCWRSSGGCRYRSL